ncbi:MAG: hypothetical protein ACUVSQ_02305 [Pseudanabaenaceae cyanobacterium]
MRKTTRAFEATYRQDVLDLVIHYPLAVLAFAVLTLQAIARSVPIRWFLSPMFCWGSTWWCGAEPLILAGGNFGDVWGDA